ncbi:hypothetical protein GOBAR_DD20896 [Gossypium barbadense]|nr:hypothetical protein GOBAR_DD20896 [Gossypium barbadense]
MSHIVRRQHPLNKASIPTRPILGHKHLYVQLFKPLNRHLFNLKRSLIIQPRIIKNLYGSSIPYTPPKAIPNKLLSRIKTSPD